MFKFLHAADIHLDSPLHMLDRYEGAPVEELRQATRRAFENLVSLAITENVDFVLFAGDLYDGDWKDYNTGLYFVSQMSELRNAGISVYMVSGNHDAASKISKTLRLPENVYVFPANRPSTFKMDNLEVAVHGQSFLSQAIKKDLSSKYPSSLSGYFNIGMLHTSATGREGHESYAPCKVGGLLSKGYDYWALGHVHKKEILHEDPWIIFPGNIQGRNMRETGPKGCMLVTVDENGRSKVDFKQLDVIRWEKIQIDSTGARRGYEIVDKMGEVAEALYVKNARHPLVVRFEILGHSRVDNEFFADLDRWTNEIRSVAIDKCEGKVWIEKIRIRSSTGGEGENFESPGGPMGELLEYLNLLGSDQDLLSSLGESLTDLAKKLPRELREVEEPIVLEDTIWLAEILKEVRPMLLSRLMKKEEFQ